MGRARPRPRLAAARHRALRARALPPERRQELTAAERTFLDASAADADAVARRERRGRIRLQVLAACAAALALLTGVTAAYLFDARSTANDAAPRPSPHSATPCRARSQRRPG
ncbi:hypothetical protein [Nocardioides kongjuensis]|uniref:hypothetical protein n=1 Tax=Nocardioides kongjuensis TaxID=349522 RepID=UPI0031E6CDEF